MSQIASLLEGFPYAPYFSDHIKGHKLTVNRITAKGEELRAVPYANGDIFVAHEEKEEVMVDTVEHTANGLVIKLVSLDKTFRDEPVEYRVSEAMLLKHYTRTSKRHPFIEEGNYSVTVGD